MQTILDEIGNTPLVALKNIGTTIAAKCDHLEQDHLHSDKLQNRLDRLHNQSE